MKHNQALLTADGNILLVSRDHEGFPLVATWFAGSYGFSGARLMPDGRIHEPARNGGAYREARERDMVFTADGRLFPAMYFKENGGEA